MSLFDQSQQQPAPTLAVFGPPPNCFVEGSRDRIRLGDHVPRTGGGHGPKCNTDRPSAALVVGSTARSAAAAGAEDLQVVADVAETVLGGDGVGPALDGRTGDLDGTAAAAADQVVVVAVGAAAVGGLAVRVPQRVQLAGLGQTTAGCGRPWSDRCCRPACAARRGSAAPYGTRAARPAPPAPRPAGGCGAAGDGGGRLAGHRSSCRLAGVSARRSGRRAEAWRWPSCT